VTSYGGCRISGNQYTKPEAIYMVSLHEGNEVEFNLEVLTGDLALALIKPCGDNSCKRSVDGINSANENLFKFKYDPGIYFLSIDARDNGGACGTYTLTVTGTNPVPDLVAGLSGSPATVTAGRILTYVLSVRNDGRLPAAEVVLKQTLPGGVTILSLDGCKKVGANTVECKSADDPRLKSLAVGSHVDKTIKVQVGSGTRGTLVSMAEAKANEGDQKPADNQKTITTTVKTEIALSITKRLSPAIPIAGKPLTYTLSVNNAGFSDATTVVVKDTLPEAVDFVSSDCPHEGRTVTCTIPRILPGKTEPRSITVLVKPSVVDGSEVTNTAEVIRAAETGPLSIKAIATTPVIRNADLSITKIAPSEVIAGATAGLKYEFAVCNFGPSDSAGATITDDLASLPPGIRLSSPLAGCTESAGRKVTCPTGPIPADKTCNLNTAKRLSFVVDVPSSQLAAALANTASIKAVEIDPNPANDTSNTVATTVRIEADLSVTKTARGTSDFVETGAAVAGANLAYQVKVENHGPSDSPGGTIHDTLPAGLTFVASPDECEVSPQDPSAVVCPVPALAAHQSYFARFVAKVPAGATGSFSNQASVESVADPNGSNDTGSSPSTAVKQEADLAVRLSGSPNPVDLSEGREILYTLIATNNGPSNAANLDVSLTLPPGSSFDSASFQDCQPTGSGPIVVQCPLASLLAGASQPITIHTHTSAARGFVRAKAAIGCLSIDPRCANNTAEAITTLADAADADLSVTKTTAVEAAVAGDLLEYTIEAVNHGPSDATGVIVEDKPPDMVSPALEPPCDTLLSNGVVRCQSFTLQKEAKESLALTVQVDPASFQPLFDKASIPNPDADPNSINNSSLLETPVVSAAPLVLPFFKTGAANDTTLLAVRNPTGSPLGLRVDYFLTGEPSARNCEHVCLPGKKIFTRSLRDRFPGSGISEGHVDISPIPIAACENTTCAVSIPTPLLTPPPAPRPSGDFIRIEPAKGHASGQPLLSTDTSRLPPELCRHWSVRFLNGGSFKGNTELFFFVPKTLERDGSGPLAVGKVYNEAGQFVQEVLVNASGEVFRRTTQEGFDNPVPMQPKVPLLASFGAIEWEFREGVVGNVSAVHRAEGGSTVAVPGFCRRPPAAEDLAPEPPLLVPYFEVELVGATTLLAVRNESESDVDIDYEFWSADGTSPFRVAPRRLHAHETRTENLRFVPELQGLSKGYIRVGVTGNPAHRARILSGDFVRVDPVSGLASGGALVDTDLHRSPPQICRKWNVRFLNGEPPGSSTDIVFYVDRDGRTGSLGAATGQVISAAGAPMGTVHADLSAAFQFPLLGVTDQGDASPGSGSVEWDLGADMAGMDVVGNVASILKAGGLSVLVPGVCLSGE